MIPIAISRVNQVDAGRLDIEMSAMLKEQLVKVFSLMKVHNSKLIGCLQHLFFLFLVGCHLICLPLFCLGLARDVIPIRTGT